MEEHSDYAMLYYYYKITTIKERTLHGLTTSLIRKPDKAYRPYTSKISTSPQHGRTTQRVNILVHKVDGPHKGQKTYTSPQRGRTPRRVKILVHKVDGPHKAKKLT